MAKAHPRLKLGKSATFVKTHLKQLPQEQETWEVDFRASPKPQGQTETHYLGLVVVLPEGDPLIYMPVEYTPTVNDLADLLADAMRRPLTGSARRPEYIHLRDNPRWGELFPHLKDLGDDNGLAFENNESKTLAEALAALEEGLTERFRDQRNDLRSSSSKAKKTQRRRRDA